MSLLGQQLLHPMLLVMVPAILPVMEPAMLRVMIIAVVELVMEPAMLDQVMVRPLLL